MRAHLVQADALAGAVDARPLGHRPGAAQQVQQAVVAVGALEAAGAVLRLVPALIGRQPHLMGPLGWWDGGQGGGASTRVSRVALAAALAW